METIQGDLLEGDSEYIIHCCNSEKIFGSGLAYFIKKKYPKAYQADLDYDVEDKLGTYSYADIEDGPGIYNIYAMRGLGNDGTHLGRNCMYDSFVDALEKICIELSEKHKVWSGIRVGLAKNTGACRAGGEWSIIVAILNYLEKKYSNIEFVIYDIGNDETGIQSTQNL